MASPSSRRRIAWAAGTFAPLGTKVGAAVRNANATAARLGRGVVTVVPVTSNIARVYPFQVLLPADETGLHVDSKAQAEQVRSVSVERLGPVTGRIPTHLMTQLDDALRLHLHL